MKRNSLLALLDAYATSEPEEIEMLITLRNFVIDNADCFERNLKTGHVTASGWVISENKQKVLLMHHRKLDRWFQPGGHCDGDPDVVAVARKEVEEETGLTNVRLLRNGIFDIDIHIIPANSKDVAHYHYDVRFLFNGNAVNEIIMNEESRDVKWVPVHEVKFLNDSESIMRMVRKTSAL